MGRRTYFYFTFILLFYMYLIHHKGRTGGKRFLHTPGHVLYIEGFWGSSVAYSTLLEFSDCGQLPGVCVCTQTHSNCFLFGPRPSQFITCWSRGSGSFRLRRGEVESLSPGDVHWHWAGDEPCSPGPSGGTEFINKLTGLWGGQQQDNWVCPDLMHFSLVGIYLDITVRMFIR